MISKLRWIQSQRLTSLRRQTCYECRFIHSSDVLPTAEGRQKSHSRLFYEVKWITSRAVHSHSSPLVNYNEVSTFTEPELEKYGASNIPSRLKVINAWPASSSLFMPLVLGPWRTSAVKHQCFMTLAVYYSHCLFQLH